MPQETNSSKFYPIEDDWKQLSTAQKNKIDNGIVIAGERVIKFYDEKDLPEILIQAAKNISEGKDFFIPQFETENFIQGLTYRPTSGLLIDKLYNREFYKDHWAKIFKSGFDPVLANVGDILVDERTGETVNWDARHRAVGYLSAREGNQVPGRQWYNTLKIKETAPKTSAFRPEKIACSYFRGKNESPKALTPEEKFVAAYRAEDPLVIRTYTVMDMAGLRIENDALPELAKAHPDSRIVTGISKFHQMWDSSVLGGGQFVARAVESIKKTWKYKDVDKVSCYFILAYCYLLRLDRDWNGEFGYDNNIMIDSLKWSFDKYMWKPGHYCSPRANGKAIESVAFHMCRAYNKYVEECNVPTKLLDWDTYIGLPTDFLALLNIEPEIDEEEDFSPIEEALSV
ncbi:MAG: hypothetical protein ACO3EO_09735 [Candidatus Kapaibacteriota bacterium]